MAQDLSLVFPPGTGQTFESIPRQQLIYPPGETTPILHDTSGRPVARLIPVEKGKLARGPIPEEAYQRYFSLLHPRGDQGTVQYPASPVTYLTQEPNMPEGKAIQQLTQSLRQHGLLQQEQQEWPLTQDILEFLGPTGGAVVGGAAGVALGGGTPWSVPLALGGATYGGAMGTHIPTATRSVLTPSRTMPEMEERQEPGVAFEHGMGAAQGLVGESLNQFVNLARLGVRTLGMHGLIRDIDLSPEQAALFAPRRTLPSGLTTPGGPFTEAAAATGELYYPRISTYARGPIETLDDRVANALLSKYRTQQHARGLERNLSALLTQEVTQLQATGENAPFGTRMMQWLGTFDKDGRFIPGSLERGARTIQNALYAAGNDLVEQAINPPRLQTTPMANILEAQGIGGGGRSAVAQTVDAKIAAQLADLERQSVRALAEGSQEVRQGAVTLGQRAQDVTTASTQAQGMSQMQGEYGRIFQPIPGGHTLQTGAESTTISVRHDLPLDGWLHTLDVAQGQHTPEITIGRGLQLRRAVNQAILEERGLGANADPAQLRLLRQFEQALDAQLNPALDAIDPALSGMYQRADRFTAQLYYDLRNETIMRDVIGTVGRNPEEFETLATHPHATQILQAIQEAFTMQRNIPATLPPGTSVPPSLRNGLRFYQNIVLPEIRFQILKSALPNTQHDLMQQLAGSGQPIQELVQQGRILKVEPGTFHNLRGRLGQETYDLTMGGHQAGETFIQLDKALIEARKGQQKGQEVGLLIAQFGGLHLMATGAGLLKAGQIGHGLTGLAAGGVLVFTPGTINRMLTDPAAFERIVLGIKTGSQDRAVQRLLADTAAYAARDLYRPSANAPTPER